MKDWIRELLELITRQNAGVEDLLAVVWRGLRTSGRVNRLSVSYVHAEGRALILGTVYGKAHPLLRTGFRETIAVSQGRSTLEFSEDLNKTRASLMTLGASGFSRLATIPLHLNGEWLGVLDVFSSERNRGNREFLDSLHATGAILAMAHERGRLIGRAHADREVKTRLREENAQLREVSVQSFRDASLLGESLPWRRLLQQVEKVATTDSMVLIRGETGTGKELIARAIHRLSRRSGKPFVAVNCGALSRELLASELFGHERGAFTGAHERRLGRFDLAQGGTLLLDEVAELPAEMQVKLLRVLQEREFERVGGSQTIKADLRILAATHRDLDIERAEGRFREDLFFRLNVLPLFVPALRERHDDIEILLRHFLEKSSVRTGKKFSAINAASLASCKAYDWPGNVRELENLVERSAILCPEPEFLIDPLGEAVRLGGSQRGLQRLDDVIAAHLKQTMKLTGGKVYGNDGASRLLGLKPSTLQAKLKKYGINKESK